LLVPAAVDAGLGEMGLFGYLITKELGPRVRIFAVTTDLPLVVDHPMDIGVEDFCRFCKEMGPPPFFYDG
jgi:epoxyqueuosine reductase QueG